MAVSSDDTNAILASQDKREESMESSLRFSIHARSDNSHALTGLGYAMGLAALGRYVPSDTGLPSTVGMLSTAYPSLLIASSGILAVSKQWACVTR